MSRTRVPARNLCRADDVRAGRGGRIRTRDFTVAAITASPCGGLPAVARRMQVERVVFRNGGRVVRMTVDDLLPEQFDAGDLA